MVGFYARLTANLAAVPGVESVGAGSDLPWTGYGDNIDFSIGGKRPAPHEDFHGRYTPPRRTISAPWVFRC